MNTASLHTISRTSCILFDMWNVVVSVDYTALIPAKMEALREKDNGGVCCSKSCNN
ncbi:hypothetical protein KKG22_05300 [Patescibacteria group bacterium]|nr:hypothetical protein [Patescibacteria group bacterium]MBU1721562.1 hypothetical protein [Patescibacteria group bacterium]MBU1901460.1 hypothetical protein [Patescibacteria group bacterium]